MKSFVVLPLLLLTIFVAGVLHLSKSAREENDIDKLAVGLKGIDNVLTEGANISYQPTDAGTNTYLYCRYLLAPHYLSLSVPASFDTLLSIYPLDKVTASVAQERKIIWQNRDANFQYFLTCRK